MKCSQIGLQTTVNQAIVVEDDFMVSLEWIEDLGEEGLYFSMSFFGSPVISRQTSQASWKKQKLVGIGFNVTAKH